MKTSVALTATWVALHTFQHGVAISGLNGIQAAVTCSTKGATPVTGLHWLKPCVAMTPAQFGLIVSVFTIGGLAASLSSRAVVHRVGVVGTLRCSALCILLGSSILGLANSVRVMIAARIIVGVGCGLATTMVPLALVEIAPPSLKRGLGIANQLFIVMGILTVQSLSFPFGKAYLWRWVPGFAATLAVVQLLGSLFVTLDNDVPTDEVPGESQALLDAEPGKILTIKELFTTDDPRVRRGFPLMLISQIAQQITGPSPIMYFSTSILSPVFPGSAKVVALIVVIFKVPMTALPGFLVDRIGTRPLMTTPTFVMAASLLCLAVGLNQDIPWAAIAGILGFVTFFSIGLGPVAWVVLGEVTPSYARPAANSVGVAVNWTTNFAVSSAFLPFQHWLAGNNGGGEGNVFYVFAGLTLLAAIAITRAYQVYDRVSI